MSVISLSKLIETGRDDGHPVAIRDGVVIPFSRLHRDVCAVAHSYKGQRVALACTDSYNFVAGFLGLLHAGADIVFPSNDLPAGLQALRTEFDAVLNDAAIKKAGEGDDVPAINATRRNLHFFTSGSTGAAKCVTKTITMLESEIETIDALWGNAANTGRVYANVPHYHVYGLTFKLLWPLSAGRPFDCATHGLWESLLDELTPNAIIVSSPAHLTRLSGLDTVPADRKPERIFSAGAPLPMTAVTMAQNIFGCAPTEIFGSTETGAIATRQQTIEQSPWHVLPGLDVKTSENDRLNLRSPFIGPDWVATDDRIALADDGFHFLGRADDIVKVEGRRVSLTNVENTLLTSPLIEHTAVIMHNGALATAIVLNADGREQLQDLGNFRFSRTMRQSFAEKLEPTAIPRLWRFVDALPAHIMGKRRKTDIQNLFTDNTGHLPAPVSVEIKDDKVAITLQLSKDEPAFEGHFPGMPILPGVVQLDWVIRFADRYLDTGKQAGQKFKVKFLHAIRPGAIALNITRDPSGRIDFSYDQGDKRFSHGQIQMGEA